MQRSINKEILHELCILSATADVLQSTLKSSRGYSACSARSVAIINKADLSQYQFGYQ